MRMEKISLTYKDKFILLQQHYGVQHQYREMLLWNTSILPHKFMKVAVAAVAFTENYLLGEETRMRTINLLHVAQQLLPLNYLKQKQSDITEVEEDDILLLQHLVLYF